LRSRGYSTTRYNALDTGYYNKATPLQVASYGTHIVNILRRGDEKQLRRYLSCGLASNPCNQFNESMLHMACRLQRSGERRLIKVMIESGCDLRCADDNGRTPLHDACWTYKPCFELIETIIKFDVHLLMIADSRDCLPLSYAPRESWSDWLQFLQSKKDELFPNLLSGYRPYGATPATLEAPPLTLQVSNSCVATDPANALSLKMAEMVATGKLEPEEAMFLSTFDTLDEMDDTEFDDDSDEESDEDYTNESTEECDDEMDQDQYDETDILQDFGVSLLDVKNIAMIPTNVVG
jgi:Ankyrin repeats (3 copies)